MKRKSLLIFLALLIVCVFAVNMVGMTKEKPVHLKWGSQELGGSWYMYAAAIAEVVRPALPEGSSIDVLPYGAGYAAMRLLHEKKDDIGLSSCPTQRWAREGILMFPEKMPELRSLLSGMDQYYLGVMVRKDSPYNTLEDLVTKGKGLRWMTLPQGSLGKFCAEQVLEFYGKSWDTIKKEGGKVEHTDFGAVTAAFRDNRCDVFIHTINQGHPTTLELAATVDIKFLPCSQKLLDYMTDKWGWIQAPIPAGSFRGQDRDVPSYGNTTGITVRTEFPEQLAYIITKTVCENAERLKKANAAFRPFDPKKAWMPIYNQIPLHPGAIRYYREMGYMK
jgi:TRAP transporter TAXI family solute receptor